MATDVMVVGLAAPYETPARTVDAFGSYTAVFDRGCFRPALEYPIAAQLLANHFEANVLAPGVEILERASGLYVACQVPAAILELLGEDLRLSVGFLARDAVTAWSRPPARVLHVREVRRVLDVSIAYQQHPVYRQTWLWPDSAAARRRIALEDLEARDREIEELRAVC